jgi:hypothetical protein
MNVKIYFQVKFKKTFKNAETGPVSIFAGPTRTLFKAGTHPKGWEPLLYTRVSYLRT